MRAIFFDATDNLETIVSDRDDDSSAVVPMPQGFVLDATGLSVDDDGRTTFTARLAIDPGQSVSAVVNREDAAHVDVSPDGLTFDETNWNTPQTVTVSGKASSGSSSQDTTVYLTSSTVPDSERVKVHVRDTSGAGTRWALRLGGNTRTEGGRVKEGRLEVAYNGEWGTVCDDRIHIPQNRAPKFACRLMGFAYGDPITNRNTADFNKSDVPIHVDDLVCLNSDDPPSDLAQCDSAPTFPNTNCEHSEDLWLRCDGDSPTPRPVSSAPNSRRRANATEQSTSRPRLGARPNSVGSAGIAARKTARAKRDSGAESAGTQTTRTPTQRGTTCCTGHPRSTGPRSGGPGRRQLLQSDKLAGQPGEVTEGKPGQRPGAATEPRPGPTPPPEGGSLPAVPVGTKGSATEAAANGEVETRAIYFHI